ncbi:Acyltransferase family protein [compost metagenome]
MSLERRIKVIDSLRGLAALIVVEHHLFSLNAQEIKACTSPFFYNFLLWLSEKNVEAVLFFFIVSGFSIGLSLRKNPIIDKKSINEYLYRRAKRILPIYWSAIIISLLTLLILPSIYNSSFSFYNLLGNLFFLQTPAITNAWFIPYGNNGPLWSLSYEFYYYLLAIPVIIYQKKIRLSPQSITLFLVSLSLLMILINHKIANPFSAFLILFPIWHIGYALSQFYINRDLNKPYFITLTCTYASLGVINFLYLNSTSLDVLNLGISISLICTFIFSLYQIQPLKGFFNFTINTFNKIFYKIGLASFSIYVSHYIVLHLLKQHNSPISIQILTLFFLIVVCYYFEMWIIKKPFSFFKRKYV